MASSVKSSCQYSVVSLMLRNAHLPFSKASLPQMYHTCLEGKFSKRPFPKHANKSVNSFNTIHTDLWGPAPCCSFDDYRYYTVFVDECTRYCWLFPLINKSDLFSTFVVFHSFICTQFSATIQVLQTDFWLGGGGEYTSNSSKQFLLAKNISHHLSCLYTPEQNRIAEGKHRHIIEMYIALLQTTKLPSQFWSFTC